MALRFDHVGFPEGTYDHLYSGWYMRYWDPMKKWAAQQGKVSWRARPRDSRSARCGQRGSGTNRVSLRTRQPIQRDDMRDHQQRNVDDRNHVSGA